MAAVLHAQGIRVHWYLDDWLIWGSLVEETALNTEAVLALFRCLGLLVRLEKPDLIPQHVFVFLGVHFDLVHGSVKKLRPRTRSIHF